MTYTQKRENKKKKYISALVYQGKPHLGKHLIITISVSAIVVAWIILFYHIPNGQGDHFIIFFILVQLEVYINFWY